MKRLIVCGCRSGVPQSVVDAKLDDVLLRRGFVDDAVTLVTGDADGADACARRYHEESRLIYEDRRDRWSVQHWKPHEEVFPLEVHIADWATFGRSAGPRRNAEIVAKGGDLCLAFWDGQSPGTLDMVRACVAEGIPVEITPIKRSR